MSSPHVFPDGPYRRNYFFVGGEYVPEEEEEEGNSNSNADKKDKSRKYGGYVMKGQAYVECLSPVEVEGVHRRGGGRRRRPFPLVLIHGAGQSGLNWLHTPDNRPGWASYFLARGFTVYIMDTPSRGRSVPDFGQNHTTFTTGFVEAWFTAPSPGKWAQAGKHSQWPGTGQRGDPVFDAFYASTYPSVTDIAAYQSSQASAIAALLHHIATPAILLTHSQGSPGGWLAADICPELICAIIAVEPNGPPFAGVHPHNGAAARAWGLTDIPIAYSPPVTNVDELDLVTIPSTEPGRDDMVLQRQDAGSSTPRNGGVVRRLKNLQHIPVLVEVGEASYHAPYDHATVAYLRQAGVECDFIRLEDRGILGNGHMQMLELNNLEIAAVLEGWISTRVEGEGQNQGERQGQGEGRGERGRGVQSVVMNGGDESFSFD
ncbi:hypothetical protein AYO20_10135 [Fonsecaea nubica]|uniref:AB hydrolase-1 domain-containing protein n=1 Tax=Fonsecaea nubica TaxID=856822 RepID=A0A178CA88_9EURO|nr:hypothetical protein AYO20_10135 [Fonsecaea nubica]OAL26467.1 hypothetical protein AYO20_10135 [Fonsecaea nubica]